MVHNFVFQRIFSAGFIFLSSLFMAKMLGPAMFGQVAFAMYLVKFILSGQLGSESGFLYQYFSKDIKFPSSSFFLLYSFQLLILALVVYILGLFIGQVYIYAAVLFCFLIPFFTLSPILRVAKLYYATLLPDVLISLVIFASVVFNKYFIRSTVTFHHIMLLALALLILFYPIILYLTKKMRINIDLHKIVNVNTLKSYFNLLWDGIPLYMGTLAYMILLVLDRFWLERLHNFNALGLYTLSFQLALGASLPLSSQNFVNLIEIGEKNREKAKMTNILINNLKKSSLLGLASYLALMGLTFILEKFFLVKYHGLFHVTAGLGFGLILFFISGSVTPIAFYSRNQKALTIFLFAIALLSLFHNLLIILFGVPQIWVAYCTSFWLTSYSIFAILFTYKKVNL